jgi:hypothetical protein
MADRRYALTRVAAGMYLCPSNDRTRLWRFYRYYEDGSLASYDQAGNMIGRPIVGHFWEAESCPISEGDVIDLDPDFLADLPWRTEGSLYPTRAAAVRFMESYQ